jgi:hypothetical protein
MTLSEHSTPGRDIALGLLALCAVVVASVAGRFCCRSSLQAFLVSDSVAVKRFATGADHDGAAQSRSGTVFLFISA